MKYKTKIPIVMICLLLMAGMASVAYGKIIDGSKIEVSLISQEPDPAEPGELVDVRFKIENLGSSGTDPILFEIPRIR